MRLEVMEISRKRVICKIEGEDTNWEIARRWLAEDIAVGDKIDIVVAVQGENMI